MDEQRNRHIPSEPTWRLSSLDGGSDATGDEEELDPVTDILSDELFALLEPVDPALASVAVTLAKDLIERLARRDITLVLAEPA